MKKLIVLISIIILVQTGAFGQKQHLLDQGIRLLQNGEYSRAQHTLQDFVNLHPQHLTGNICLGRALGLQGHVNSAQTIFNKLLEQHPQDSEILLNIAESHLWSNLPDQGIDIYEVLLNKDPELTPALIGMANALSIKREHAKALPFIKKATTIDSSEYVKTLYQSIVSAAAYRFKEINEIDSAINLLIPTINENSSLNDKLLAADLWIQNNSFRKAVRVLPTQSKNEDVLIKLAYLSLLQGKPSATLQHLETVSTDQHLTKVLALSFEAYMALEKPLEIEKLIEEYSEIINGDHQLKLFVKKYNAIRSSSWEEVQTLDSTISTLENIMVFVAARASKSAINASNIDIDKNPDPSLKRQHGTSLQLGTKFQSDINDNQHIISHFGGQYHWSNKNTSRVGVSNNLTSNILNQQSQTSSLQYHHSYAPNRRWNIEVGLDSYFASSTNFSRVSFMPVMALQYITPFNTSIRLDYDRNIHNYTPDMLEANLTSEKWSLKYSNPHINKLSFYSEIQHERFNDSNSKNLVFLSLYKVFQRHPIVKSGMNISFIQFAQNDAETYFSPESYWATEAFVQISRLEPSKSKWLYSIECAIGNQKINSEKWQLTYRGNLKLGYSISKLYDICFTGEYSNSASTSIAGFSQYSIGMNLKVHL